MNSKQQMPDCAGTSFTILSIPNYLSCRQEKSIDYVLVNPVNMAVERCKKIPEFLENLPLSKSEKQVVYR